MDFDSGKIIVKWSTSVWGPFAFHLPAASSASANDGAIPYGTTISSVSVVAYLGNITGNSTLDDETEITSDLIASAAVSESDSSLVNVYLSHPGEDYKGETATLIITVTLSNGGAHPFYFYPVVIQ